MRGDQVVAITRLPVTWDEGGYRATPGLTQGLTSETLTALARVLGLAPADVRLRLGGGTPWTVARQLTLERAAHMLEQLHDLGCGAVQMSLSACHHPGEAPAATLRGGGMVNAKGEEILTFAKVWLLVSATHDERTRLIYAFSDQSPRLFKQDALEQIDLWGSLRVWCPQSRVDERLTRWPHRHPDLAAHLLAVAWRLGQID